MTPFENTLSGMASLSAVVAHQVHLIGDILLWFTRTALRLQCYLVSRTKRKRSLSPRRFTLGQSYHCIFQVLVWPERKSPQPGAPTGALYSSRALKLSGSHGLPVLFLTSLAPMLLGGAETVPLKLTFLGSPVLIGAISVEHPGALCRVLNSPLQVAISSVRNLIFSPPTTTSCSFSGSWVVSRGEAGTCKEWRSPSESVKASAGNGARRFA